jgi:hypothetical protein
MSRPPVDAVLQAGDTETLYRRAGDGPPVLLLCSGALADPLGSRLFERLAMRARVIAPVMPRGDASDVMVTWLDEVTEGLGLVRPTVVLDAALAPVLLDGDVVAAERFARVIVAVDGAGDERAARLATRGAIVVPVTGADASAVAAAMLPFLDPR